MFFQKWQLFAVFAVFVGFAAFRGIQAPPASGSTKPYMYELIVSGAKMEHTNPDFVGPGSYFRVNQSLKAKHPVMNAYIPLLQDLPPDTNSSWQAYSKIRNKWIETLVRGSLLFCNLLTTKIAAYREIYRTSNFPQQCPVKKGNYTIVDFAFDVNQLPAVVTGSEWRVRNWWTTGSDPILNFLMELKIERTTKDTRG